MMSADQKWDQNILKVATPLQPGPANDVDSCLLNLNHDHDDNISRHDAVLDVLLDAWGKALAANVNMTALKWVMTPREFVGLRKLKDGDGRYMMQPDPTLDGVFRLFGAPVIVTARVPDGDKGAGRAALVDFSQIAVARDLAPSVKILTERYADFDQQAIRVVARYDAAPLNPAAVVTLTGITPAA